MSILYAVLRGFDKAMQIVLTDIRSTPASGTGKTPFYMLFGRDMNTRYHLIDNNNKQITASPRCYNERYAQLDRRRNAQVIHFEPTSRVLVRCGRNIRPKYGRIIKKAGHGSWVVDLDDGYERVVNQRFIKLWKGDVPTPNDTDIMEVPQSAGPSHQYNLRPRYPINYRE